MKKIQLQSAFSVDAFDFKVVYSSDGTAVIIVALLNNDQSVKTTELPITKEETDQWQTNDSIIIAKIQAEFPNINFTEITE